MHALEIINALNDPDNPAKPKTGLNAVLSGAKSPNKLSGPICPRCEHLSRGQHNNTEFVRSNLGAMLYSCNECKLEFYG